MDTVGKELNILLKSIKVKDEDGKVIDIKYKRLEIEQVLIQQNIKYYKKVLNTPVYKDRIYDKLADNDVRNRILDGTLRYEEYDSIEVYKFLKLLETNKHKS